MDRLMCLHVETSGEAVQALVNGLPVAALPAAAGQRCVPVHEYLLTGKNHLALMVAPAAVAAQGAAAPAQPRLAAAAQAIRARLLLLRAGQSPQDAAARALAEVHWAVAEGASFEAPLVVEREIDLPVIFARWRWLDAPVISLGAAERQSVLGLLQRIAFDLSKGNGESLIAASRLKFEELAQAYQWPAEQPPQRLRARLAQLYKDQALSIEVPQAQGLVLHPVAGGRLLECLAPSGEPVLSTHNDSGALDNHSWPVRLALVEGRPYVLR